jgi:hypothetical protein
MFEACDSKAVRKLFPIVPDSDGYAWHFETLHFGNDPLNDLFELRIFDVGC